MILDHPVSIPICFQQNFASHFKRTFKKYIKNNKIKKSPHIHHLNNEPTKQICI